MFMRAWSLAYPACVVLLALVSFVLVAVVLGNLVGAVLTVVAGLGLALALH